MYDNLQKPRHSGRPDVKKNTSARLQQMYV